METVKLKNMNRRHLKKFTEILEPVAAQYIKNTEPTIDGLILWAGFMDGALYVLDNIKDFYP